MTFIRAYLRASTTEQNALRAKQALIDFASEHNQSIASFYIENESGSTLNRPELHRLINDSQRGDIILIEQVDRLARLNQTDWISLKTMLDTKRIAVVSPELPTSWVAMSSLVTDDFTGAIISAVNGMLLDMLAAIARKDYEDRRRRQAQGIAKAKTEGKYKGRTPDHGRRQAVERLLQAESSWSDIQKMLGCSRHLIATVRKTMNERTQPGAAILDS